MLVHARFSNSLQMNGEKTHVPFCKTLSDTIPVTARQLQAALEKLPTPLNCRANKGCTTLADWQARLDKLLLELAAEQAPQLVPEVRFCALAVVLGAWSQNLSRTRRHFFFFACGGEKHHAAYSGSVISFALPLLRLLLPSSCLPKEGACVLPPSSARDALA